MRFTTIPITEWVWQHGYKVLGAGLNHSIEPEFFASFLRISVLRIVFFSSIKIDFADVWNFPPQNSRKERLNSIVQFFLFPEFANITQTSCCIFVWALCNAYRWVHDHIKVSPNLLQANSTFLDKFVKNFDTFCPSLQIFSTYHRVFWQNGTLLPKSFLFSTNMHQFNLFQNFTENGKSFWQSDKIPISKNYIFLIKV